MIAALRRFISFQGCNQAANTRRIVMANKVAGDLYFDLDGQLAEIKRQLRQQNGYSFDPKLLKSHLQNAIEGRFTSATGTFKRDMRKEGWTLLENVPQSINSAIDGVSFLKSGEDYVNGEEMVRRARLEFNANYGQEDAEWLLDHQNLIPAELRKFYLVFPGTVWQCADGDRHVLYLYWGGGRWILSFSCLGVGWCSGDRLVSPRK